MNAIRKNSRLTVLLLCVALVALYILLYGKYRPSEVDDAWTASYVWNLTHLGTSVDLVFGAISNVQYFGHIHAFLAGFVADHFGWSKKVFHSFNLFCMAGAALAWYLTASRLLKDKGLALICVLLLFMLEPFIGAAYKARSDALAFLFVSWSACAASYHRFFLAVLINSIGVEIHAIASVGYFWTLAFLLCSWKENRNAKDRIFALSACIFGGVLGFIIYRLLHPEPLSEIFAYLANSNRYQGSYGDSFTNALAAHYFTRAYFRFIPELIFWVVGSIAYFYKKKRVFSFSEPVGCLFWMTILASIIVRRGNFHYVIFFYPPLLITAMAGFSRTFLFRTTVICLCLYAVLGGILLAWQNRYVDHDVYDRNVAAMGIPDDGSPVIGPANAWFVLRERPFYVRFGALKAAQQPRHLDSIYYIKSAYTKPLPECAQSMEELGTPFTFNGKRMELFRVDVSCCSWE